MIGLFYVVDGLVFFGLSVLFIRGTIRRSR